ncbi:MAG: pro-sigmaK processing inhibitor BofA family protein [Halobacteriales archaeon]
MVSAIEIGLVLLAIVALYAAYRILKAAKALAVNAIVGVILLVLANVAGLGVEITIWAVLVCAIAGIPGAILVVLLAYLDVAFAAVIVALAVA